MSFIQDKAGASKVRGRIVNNALGYSAFFLAQIDARIILDELGKKLFVREYRCETIIASMFLDNSARYERIKRGFHFIFSQGIIEPCPFIQFAEPKRRVIGIHKECRDDCLMTVIFRCKRIQDLCKFVGTLKRLPPGKQMLIRLAFGSCRSASERESWLGKSEQPG